MPAAARGGTASCPGDQRRWCPVPRPAGAAGLRGPCWLRGALPPPAAGAWPFEDARMGPSAVACQPSGLHARGLWSARRNAASKQAALEAAGAPRLFACLQSNTRAQAEPPPTVRPCASNGQGRRKGARGEPLPTPCCRRCCCFCGTQASRLASARSSCAKVKSAGSSAAGPFGGPTAACDKPAPPKPNPAGTRQRQRRHGRPSAHLAGGRGAAVPRRG